MAKALGAGMAEAEKDRLRQQEISREKKDIAVGKKTNKSDPARTHKHKLVWDTVEQTFLRGLYGRCIPQRLPLQSYPNDQIEVQTFIPPP